ncbi:NAD(P)-dependent oxidoreductase [Leptospira sp. 201903070]|uniref:NAD(P)-dependent oxidoreductase n=1 Tax=Leptospira ainlahdjerensis TaxID=2810033 RepID=A0ABS2UA89_9LEPT|nr:NAD(P)-dependent oxidoreductase [Leptospira ainlahdjerensis]MBM9577289.1 NAD(P)-dependent oxidoreductase [Leptospira ainlahdjerensis]
MIDVLLTGASGFIGKALVQNLQNRNLQYFALDRKAGDIANPETWINLPKARTVVHLAGNTFVPESWKNTYLFINSNVMGTQNALDYAESQQAQFVFISAYLYGRVNKLPISELDSVSPNNPYALSKYLAEQLCKFYAEYKNLNVRVLRLFNVYGPGQKEYFLIPSIIKQILEKNEIRVLDLKPKRDYVFLRDVVDAIVSACEPLDGFQIFNIGSGRSYSVEEVIGIIQKIANTSLPIVSNLVERKEEISDVIADISKARNLLGWEPKYTFDSGINEILNASSSTK